MTPNQTSTVAANANLKPPRPWRAHNPRTALAAQVRKHLRARRRRMVVHAVAACQTTQTTLLASTRCHREPATGRRRLGGKGRRMQVRLRTRGDRRERKECCAPGDAKVKGEHGDLGLRCESSSSSDRCSTAASAQKAVTMRTLAAGWLAEASQEGPLPCDVFKCTFPRMRMLPHSTSFLYCSARFEPARVEALLLFSLFQRLCRQLWSPELGGRAARFRSWLPGSHWRRPAPAQESWRSSSAGSTHFAALPLCPPAA